MTEIETDLTVLDAINQDMASASPEFQPTGPTADIVERLNDELRMQSLNESMRKGSKLLNTIGAINYPPRQQLEYTFGLLREKGSITDAQSKALSAAYDIVFADPECGILPYELSITSLNEAAYRAAEQFGQLCGARPIDELSLLQSDNSMYQFKIEGRSYSYVFLYYYMRYAYCCRFLDFSNLKNYIELGSGSGRQVEIIKQLHPQINIYVVDLPPQLYVCRQLLGYVFKGDIVSYETTRRSEFSRIEGAGKIATLLPHQLKTLKPEGLTLSWNCMVYCIMPRDVVRNYLRLLSPLADLIYIIEPMPNTSDSKYGVSNPVQFEDYVEFLKPDFVNVDRSKAFRPLGQMKGGWGEGCDTFWKKNVRDV